ncbi:MAG: tyrosine-protein kinase Etk/Wzc, partial [Chitinophagales bacterium]
MENKENKILGERKELKNVLEEFNIGVLLHAAQKSLLWVVLFFIVSIAVAFFYLRHTQRVYSSSTTLMRKVTKQTRILGVEDLLSEDKSEIDIEIQLLKSKFLLSAALDSLPLRTDYYTKGKISRSEFYKNQPFDADFSDYSSEIEELELEVITDNKVDYKLSFVLKSTDYSFQGAFGKNLKTPFFTLRLSKNNSNLQTNQLYAVKLRNYGRVIDEIAAKLKISPLNYSSNTLKISIENSNPLKANEIINAISKYFIKYDKIKKGESIDNTIVFLNEQIENFGNQFYNTQDSLKKFRLETGFLEPSAQIAKKMNELELLEKDLLMLDLNQSSLSWLEQYLRSGNDLSNLSGLMLTNQSLTFQSSIDAIIGLQSERNLKLLNVTPDHPNILLINKEINILRDNVLSQISLARNKQDTDKNLIDSKIQQNYKALYDLPDKESDYSELKRENDLKQSFYLSLVSKKNMYLISKAG